MNNKGADSAFEVVFMLSVHVTVEGMPEPDRDKPVEINVFLQKADKSRLVLLDGFRHTVVDVSQGYFHD